MSGSTLTDIHCQSELHPALHSAALLHHSGCCLKSVVVRPGGAHSTV